MIFDLVNKSFYTNGGALIKKLECPLSDIKWKYLNKTEKKSHRHCMSCNKQVIDSSTFSEEGLEDFLRREPEACVKVSIFQDNITVQGLEQAIKKDNGELRKIRSAFGETEINEGVQKGYTPLIKWVHQNNHRLRMKSIVYQHVETGEVYIAHDYRDNPKDSKFKKVLEKIHYPHRRTSPVGAYLIPMDLKVGERVYLEGVLDDYIGEVSNQGDYHRLKGCSAIFLGLDKGFALEFDESDVVEVIG